MIYEFTTLFNHQTNEALMNIKVTKGESVFNCKKPLTHDYIEDVLALIENNDKTANLPDYIEFEIDTDDNTKLLLQIKIKDDFANKFKEYLLTVSKMLNIIEPYHTNPFRGYEIIELTNIADAIVDNFIDSSVDIYIIYNCAKYIFKIVLNGDDAYLLLANLRRLSNKGIVIGKNFVLNNEDNNRVLYFKVESCKKMYVIKNDKIIRKLASDLNSHRINYECRNLKYLDKESTCL